MLKDYLSVCVRCARRSLIVCLAVGWLTGTATYTEAQSALPVGWQTTDIGSPVISGSATFSGCTPAGDPSCGGFAVGGAGIDVSGKADQFHFVYRKLTGDGTIIARVDSLQSVGAWSKAGVMIRESLTTGARHAFALASPTRGVAFSRRRTNGGTTVTTVGAALAAPIWVRLERRGLVITASRSFNGTSWIPFGVDAIAFSDTVYVGIAVTSNDPRRTTTARLSGLSVMTMLPDEWDSSDVGAPILTGSAVFADEEFTVIGSGADIGGTADQFRFAYRQLASDVDVTARVTGITAGSARAKVGVMFRESLSKNAAHAALFINAAKGVLFQRRLAAGLGTPQTSGPAQATPGWVKLEKRGDVITALSSTNGSLWTVVGSEVVPLPGTFYVGLAVTSGSAASSARATVDSVTITEHRNLAPTVAITTPLVGGAVATGSAVTLTAAADDADGTVSAVDFYVDSTLIGTVTAPPFAVSWPAIGSGAHSIVAIARDDRGAATSSSTMTLSVAAAVPAPAPAPMAPAYVRFTPSADHETGVVWYSLRLFASGVDVRRATPVATQNLGLPPLVNGECRADITALMATVPNGKYVAVVSAVGWSGETASVPSPAYAK